MSDLPPAGWFDDPDDAGYLRYWDGNAWTDYRAPRTAPQSGTGPLWAIGEWLSRVFSDLWARRIQLLALASLMLVAVTVAGAAASWAVDDLVWFDGEWSGYDGSRIATAAFVIAGATVASIFVYLAIVHQMHRAAIGGQPTVTDSLVASVRATPRLIGWILIIVFVFIGALFVIGIAAVVFPPIGILMLLALIPVGFWLWVRLAFMAVAVVAPEPDRNPVVTSADVSAEGRFWPVCGRLLLLGLIGFAVSFALSIPVNFVTGTGQSLDGIVEFDEDENEFMLFHVGEFVDEIMGGGGWLLLVGTIPSLASTIVGIAGTAALYAQVKGRPDPD